MPRTLFNLDVILQRIIPEIICTSSENPPEHSSENLENFLLLLRRHRLKESGELKYDQF